MGSVVLTIAYGFVRDQSHDFLKMGEENGEIFFKSLGGYTVDLLPICGYYFIKMLHGNHSFYPI